MVLLPLEYPPPQWFINKVFFVVSAGCAIYYLTSCLVNFIPYCLPVWDQIPPNSILFEKKKYK